MWRDVLREAGFEARRGMQYSGSPDSPDVVCESLPNYHNEVKFVQAGNPYVWMEQAIKDAGDKIPLVAHKRNGKDWLVIMRASDAINLIKKAEGI
jgi:hypothetical protein